MCHHTSSTFHTRRIKWVSETDSHGTGRVRMIEYVKLIAKDLYQGRLRDGKPYFITGARIRAKPKMYRLRKEHADCYQLVITQIEKYRELESAVEQSCGPMQRDMQNRVRTLFHLCNGQTVTDKALKYDENLRELDIVEIEDSDFKARTYLRETYMVGVDNTLPMGHDTDRDLPPPLTSTAVSHLPAFSAPRSQREVRESRESIELPANLDVDV